MKYKKKPVVIEAVQWTGENTVNIMDFCTGAYIADLTRGGHAMVIPTMEDGSQNVTAKHVASVGDFIIKGIKGEFYACKPDIFEETYEPIEEWE